MKEFRKTTKLCHVGYDIRGPVADEAARMAAAGISIIPLNTGNPAVFGLYAPDFVEDALKNAVRRGEAYSDSIGVAEAREAVAAYYKTKGLRGVTAKDVFTGNGVSELINITVQALLDNGDEILIPTPDYPLWTGVATLCGGKVVHYLCDEAADWQPDIRDIQNKITPKTKAIVLINPNNPTGALYPRETIEQVVKLAYEHDLMIFSDEIYDRLTFDGAEHVSTAAVDGADDVFIVTFGGLSKSHMVAGYRSGWIAFSGRTDLARDYIEGVRMLASMRMCANVPAQLVIPAALEHAYSAAPLMAPGGRVYEQRECVYRAITDIPGLSAVKPKAAFYIFPKIDVKRFDIVDDERFVLDFLHEHHVLMTHGRGFNYPHPDHFRIVYLPEVSDLEEIAKRMRGFLSGYSQKGYASE
ncbi:MAG: pyridoxal phosphate-dependent aminotransferase [Clostridiales Family XIII bacterium]|jgi:alanine-synthesizing transaminase|nr:pyridoxal phosphate-dependent aminotransferase [Clostridiales Family XIII bacterium]